ncbi:MAG: hypothetical protein CEE38_02805 [Planctomycetes bacterium B3_Pla]|nr:MAG: hypothetical protein CEE38_02805 [Planctomycetes bacterium B3_Pla]
MKDRDIDTHLRQYLSGDQPREAFKQQALRDSTAEFVRLRRRRSAWRRAEFAAAAVLIAGIAFIGGRLSVPRKLPRSLDIAPRVTAVPGTPRGEPEGVIVPSDLVAWLDAAHLFRRLGMEERMARAVEHAGKLLPYDAMAANSITGQALAANDGDEVIENQNKRSILAEILRPDESVEHVSGIMAQSFGGYHYENEMD